MESVIRKVIFLLNLLDSSTTNIVKVIFVILTEDIQKKITLVMRKC